MLSQYGIPGDDTPFIQGSALQALEAVKANPGLKKGDDKWCEKILELMETIDEYVDLPERGTDKPFLLAIEDAFSIPGRGTVTTGRVEQGVVKKGNEIEILGRGGKPRKSVVKIVRQSIVGIVTGYKQKQKAVAQKQWECKKGKKYALLDLCPKETSAIRRRVTPGQKDAKTRKKAKTKFSSFPMRQLDVHPVRLGLALNFSAFQHGVLKDTTGAVSTPRQAPNKSSLAIASAPEEFRNDAIMTMQLLDDNLHL